tara:strand:+ start:422 stop:2539 length:2118 start_codon:yes stop_codon:yes gene_type:complete
MAEPIKNQNPVLPGIQKLTTPQVKTPLTSFDGADFLSFFESEIGPSPAPKPQPKAREVEEPPKKIPLKSKEKERPEPREVEARENTKQQESKPKKIDRKERSEPTKDDNRETSRANEEESVDQSKSDSRAEESANSKNEDKNSTESSDQNQEDSVANDQTADQTEDGQEAQSNEQNSAEESENVATEQSLENEEIALQMGLNLQDDGLSEVLETNSENELDGVLNLSDLESNLTEAETSNDLFDQVQDIVSETNEDIEQSDNQLTASLSPLIQIDNLQASPELRDRLTELLENIEEGLEQGLFELDDSLGDDDFDVDLSQFVDLLKELVGNPQPSLQPVIDNPTFQEQLIKLDDLIDQSVSIFEDSVNLESENLEGDSIEVKLEDVELELMDESEKPEKIKSKQKDAFKNIGDLDQSSDIKKVEVKTADQRDSSLDKKINKMLAVARQGMSLRETVQEVPKQQLNNTVLAVNNEMATEVNQNLQGESQSGKQSSQNRTLDLMNNLMQKGGTDKANLGQRFAEVLEPVQKAQAKDPSGLSTQDTSTRKTQAGQMIKKPAFARSQSVILNQVIEASKGLKPPIMNSIKIILKPAHLGELRLEVRQLDDHMRVKLEADSQTVKEVLDKNSQAIRDALRQQGLDVDRIEVELRQQKQDQQEQQAEQEAKDSDSKKNKDKKEFSLEDELAETLVAEDVLDHQGTQVNQLV